jgi:hypothetical protein
VFHKYPQYLFKNSDLPEKGAGVVFSRPIACFGDKAALSCGTSEATELNKKARSSFSYEEQIGRKKHRFIPAAYGLSCSLPMM